METSVLKLAGTDSCDLLGPHAWAVMYIGLVRTSRVLVGLESCFLRSLWELVLSISKSLSFFKAKPGHCTVGLFGQLARADRSVQQDAGLADRVPALVYPNDPGHVGRSEGDMLTPHERNRLKDAGQDSYHYVPCSWTVLAEVQ